MRQLCQLVGSQLHITTAHHPQSHGTVERLNASIQAMLRAFIHDEPSWIRLLPTAQLALNTAVNRTTGVSPFKALFGFDCRSPVTSALGLNLAPVSEPVERAALLSSTDLRARINQAQHAADIRAQQLAHRRAHGRTEFDIGEYVLLFNDSPANKLERRWVGPYIVDSKATNLTYNVSSLIDDSVHKVHINRMHPFDAGDLTSAQLHSQARRVDEYDITSVLGHRRDPAGNLQLQVTWEGYDNYDPSDDRAWCPHELCARQGPVIEYLREHNLTPAAQPAAATKCDRARSSKKKGGRSTGAAARTGSRRRKARDA